MGDSSIDSDEVIWRVSMSAIGRDLYRYRPLKTETWIDVFRMVSLFCWAGLLVSLIGDLD